MYVYFNFLNGTKTFFVEVWELWGRRKQFVHYMSNLNKTEFKYWNHHRKESATYGNGLIPFTLLSLLLSIYALRKSKHSVFDILYSMLAVKIDLDTSRVYRDLCYSIFF